MGAQLLSGEREVQQALCSAGASTSGPTREEQEARSSLRHVAAVLTTAKQALGLSLERLAAVESQRDGLGPHPITTAISAREEVARALNRVQALLDYGVSPASSDDPFIHLELHRRAQQESHGDYLREQLQQYGAGKIQTAQAMNAMGVYAKSDREVTRILGGVGRADSQILPSMADRARAADQLSTGMPNDCAGSTACDHAAGLCGAVGSGGES